MFVATFILTTIQIVLTVLNILVLINILVFFNAAPKIENINRENNQLLTNDKIKKIEKAEKKVNIEKIDKDKDDKEKEKIDKNTLIDVEKQFVTTQGEIEPQKKGKKETNNGKKGSKKEQKKDKGAIKKDKNGGNKTTFDEIMNENVNEILKKISNNDLNVSYHIVGLDNIGLSCYINSTIQCLACIKELFDEIIRCCQNDINKIKFNCLRYLFRIIIMFWIPENHVKNYQIHRMLETFKFSLPKNKDCSFAIPTEEDPNDLLYLLMDMIKQHENEMFRNLFYGNMKNVVAFKEFDVTFQIIPISFRPENNDLLIAVEEYFLDYSISLFPKILIINVVLDKKDRQKTLKVPPLIDVDKLSLRTKCNATYVLKSYMEHILKNGAERIIAGKKFNYNVDHYIAYIKNGINWYMSSDLYYNFIDGVAVDQQLILSDATNLFYVMN